MAVKQLAFEADARAALLAGVEKLAAADKKRDVVDVEDVDVKPSED